MHRLCIVPIIFLLAGCTKYQPIRPVASQATDSVAIGNVRVTKMSGQTIHLESAFIKRDSIIGVADKTKSFGVPMDSVRSIDKRSVDAMSAVRVLQLGAAVLLLIGAIQFFSGGGACC